MCASDSPRLVPRKDSVPSSRSSNLSAWKIACGGMGLLKESILLLFTLAARVVVSSLWLSKPLGAIPALNHESDWARCIHAASGACSREKSHMQPSTLKRSLSQPFADQPHETQQRSAEIQPDAVSSVVHHFLTLNSVSVRVSEEDDTTEQSFETKIVPAVIQLDRVYARGRPLLWTLATRCSRHRACSHRGFWTDTRQLRPSVVAACGRGKVTRSRRAARSRFTVAMSGAPSFSLTSGRIDWIAGQ